MKTACRYEDFKQQYEELPQAIGTVVIVLEGSRQVRDQDSLSLIALGAQLARNLPDAIFRSGNATGADELFSTGITSVDPHRMQYILPYSAHRSSCVATGAASVSLGEITTKGLAVAERATCSASPKYEALLRGRDKNPRLRAKSNYILRDTIKILGDAEQGLAPASLGLFYVRDDLPPGGTAHTIRVCESAAVPVFTQTDWMSWFPPQKGDLYKKQ